MTDRKSNSHSDGTVGTLRRRLVGLVAGLGLLAVAGGAVAVVPGSAGAVTTNPHAGHHYYTFTGTVTAPNVSMPLNLPIKGVASLDVSSDGTVTGRVDIPAVTIQESIEGLIPVRETIQLTVGAVSGSYPANGPLSLNLPINVSVPWATVLYLLPVVVPLQNCKGSPIAVTVAGVGSSLTLSGTTTMGSFSGCGLASSYVNDIAGATTYVTVAMTERT